MQALTRPSANAKSTAVGHPHSSVHVPAAVTRPLQPHTVTNCSSSNSSCDAVPHSAQEVVSTSGSSGFGRRQALSLLAATPLLAQAQNAWAVQVRLFLWCIVLSPA